MSTLVISAINGVWQGSVLAALVALIIRVIPRASAATTCAVWTATYVLIAALPFIDAATVHVVSASPIVGPQSGSISSTSITVGTQPPLLPAAVRIASMHFVSGWGELNTFVSHLAPMVFACWAVVALILTVRLLRGYAALFAIKRGARPFSFAHATFDLRSGRAARLACSSILDIPCAVGFIHPLIVIPSELADTLDADDLARVIVHERAHVQRRDDYVDLVERFVRALFFFHPALHYVARRIALDREIACDDMVVSECPEPSRYARCLADVAAFRNRGRLAAGPSLFAGRSQVVTRVDRLIDPHRNGSQRIARTGVSIVAAALLTMSILARLQIPVVAAGLKEMPVPHDARSHARTDLLDSVADGTGPQPTVDQLVMLADHGVDGDFVVAMRAFLHDKPTVDQLIELADHGVRPAAVRSLTQLGYPKLTVNELVEFADVDIDASYITHLCERGMCHVSTADLIKLAENGVGR